MLANLIKLVFSALGFAMGQGSGAAQPGPQMPTFATKMLDKFSGIAVAGGAIWWAIGNRQDVVSLNYLELAAVVLIFNLAMKVDPPGPGPGPSP